MIITEPSSKKWFHCLRFYISFALFATHDLSLTRAHLTNNQKNKNKSLSRVISISEYRGRYKMRQEEFIVDKQNEKKPNFFRFVVFIRFFSPSNKAANET